MQSLLLIAWGDYWETSHTRSNSQENKVHLSKMGKHVYKKLNQIAIDKKFVKYKLFKWQIKKKYKDQTPTK